MRCVFMGTPDFAVPVLDALVGAGHEVAAVYTQPPRPGGRRGRELVASPVQRRAEALGLPVRSPVSLRGAEAQAEFAAWRAEVAVVAAYGLILPPPVLASPGRGCLNVHASLLPRWRGAAPIQRAILAGDAETGVCIMQMEAGLDTGPVLLEGRLVIGASTAGELSAALATLGAALMVEALAGLDQLVARVQPEAGITYAVKVLKAEARLDFARDADAVARQVLAFDPAPGAWVEVGGERVKVWGVEAVALGARSHAVPSPRPASGRSRPARSEDSRELSSSDAPQRGEGEGASIPSPLRGEGEGASIPSPLRGEGKRAERSAGEGTACDPQSPITPGTTLDAHLTIACAAGAVRPTLLQRPGRGIVTTAEFLRGFPVPPGTRL